MFKPPLLNIVTKALLVKSDSFDVISKEKFLLMVAMTAGIKVNLSFICSTSWWKLSRVSPLALLLNSPKFFENYGVPLSATQYWNKFKMLDTVNVLSLRPKVSTETLATVKNEFGESQEAVTKENSNRNLALLNDSEKTTCLGFDFILTHPFSKKKSPNH